MIHKLKTNILYKQILNKLFFLNTKKPPFYRWLNRLLKTALKKTITKNQLVTQI